MTGRPEANEYAEFYAGYVELASTEEDIVPALARQIDELTALVRRIPEEKTTERKNGKWSLRETLGHINDGERIFSYRAFRISRKDTTPLASFEQDDYVREGNANERPSSELLEEFSLLRKGTVAGFRHVTPEIGLRRGVASGKEVTARAMLYIALGHVRHHMKLIQERYGV